MQLFLGLLSRTYSVKYIKSQSRNNVIIPFKQSDIFIYLDRRGIGISSHGYWDGKLLHEHWKCSQFPWEYEVKEGPELL